MKEDLLGYGVDAYSVSTCVDNIFDSLLQPNRVTTWLACLNPHSYVVALHDSSFRQALKDADWLIPDGAGILMASSMLSGHLRERVTGSDVFSGLLQRMDAIGGMSVFFLGATEETLALIGARLAKDYPNIKLAGLYSPSFKPIYSPAEIDEMLNAINAVQPDVLWVGMTAPKQEKWIHENRTRLKVGFAGAIGAVFDFYAGKVNRAHPAIQRLGLEWLPRLVQQPRRLWRRMFVSAPIFLWHVIKARLCNAG